MPLSSRVAFVSTARPNPLPYLSHSLFRLTFTSPSPSPCPPPLLLALTHILLFTIALPFIITLTLPASPSPSPFLPHPHPHPPILIPTLNLAAVLYRCELQCWRRCVSVHRRWLENQDPPLRGKSRLIRQLRAHMHRHNSQADSLEVRASQRVSRRGESSEQSTGEDALAFTGPPQHADRGERRAALDVKGTDQRAPRKRHGGEARRWGPTPQMGIPHARFISTSPSAPTKAPHRRTRIVSLQQTTHASLQRTLCAVLGIDWPRNTRKRLAGHHHRNLHLCSPLRRCPWLLDNSRLQFKPDHDEKGLVISENISTASKDIIRNNYMTDGSEDTTQIVQHLRAVFDFELQMNNRFAYTGRCWCANIMH